ncbi:hypothetical protein [Streptomyces fuscichromogenes]|uniref:Uncharacterized protein n=1 Tax=Streptomyces fuscichromogenes TaxID=1324013 RepID=A0A917XRE7_9ACTN|nr:hypothetical protein [Streptomyces fuscichromogenes]GGN47246.1 hypothetical protein GCM10011578_100740 [Streptomyces fuscichromogenes]
MTPEVFLALCALASAGLIVAARVLGAVADRRRPPARIVQPPHPEAAPEVTHWEPEWALIRARRVRRMRGRARFCLDNPADRAARFAERDHRTTP